MKNKLNFTVGPVQMSEEIRNIGSNQVPYFRTSEFSQLMLENEKLIKKFANADNSSRVAFITGSGTASMEATIINTITKKDKVLVINGGSFGQRFVDLLKLHEVPYEEIKLNIGNDITQEELEKYKNKSFTVFLVNIHETSTGVKYNLNLISNFCKKNNLFLIVDSISSFLADEIDVTKSKIDALIIGSQKALACPPGISVIILSKNAIERINKIECKVMYFDLKNILKNGERGQTPFTPAVGILIQINARLKQIEKAGGALSEINKVKKLATYFRENIKDLPFEMVSNSPSNAVTSLYCKNNNATQIFTILKDKYNIWICPNGGNLKERVIRVGHIGDLTNSDYDKLIFAFKDMQKRGIL